MHKDQFIEGLAARLGLPQLAFNQDSVCRLLLEDRFAVDLEWIEHDASIFVYAVVHGRASDVSSRFAEILAANLFGYGVNDAILGLDLQRDEILLTRKFRLVNLDIEWFVQELERFVRSAIEWSTRLGRSPATRNPTEAKQFDIEASGNFLRV